MYKRQGCVWGFAGDFQRGLLPADKLTPEEVCKRLDVVYDLKAGGQWTLQMLSHAVDPFGFKVDADGMFIKG